jgi:hypothetical protein
MTLGSQLIYDVHVTLNFVRIHYMSLFLVPYIVTIYEVYD